MFLIIFWRHKIKKVFFRAQKRLRVFEPVSIFSSWTRLARIPPTSLERVNLSFFHLLLFLSTFLSPKWSLLQAKKFSSERERALAWSEKRNTSLQRRAWSIRRGKVKCKSEAQRCLKGQERYVCKATRPFRKTVGNRGGWILNDGESTERRICVESSLVWVSDCARVRACGCRWVRAWAHVSVSACACVPVLVGPFQTSFCSLHWADQGLSSGAQTAFPHEAWFLERERRGRERVCVYAPP